MQQPVAELLAAQLVGDPGEERRPQRDRDGLRRRHELVPLRLGQPEAGERAVSRIPIFGQNNRLRGEIPPNRVEFDQKFA